MTLEVKNEVNYSAFVVAVEKIIPLDKCDNVVGVPVGGYVAIVGKDTQVGDVLVVFPAESQLSDEFVRTRNLYRDATLNADPEQKGYIEKNRRIKAMKFRGHRSDALAMPASTFDHPLVPGDVFDTIDGVEICRKYVLPVNENTSKAKTAQEKAWKRVDDKFLPEHVDTEHYGRNSFKIDPDEHVIITQKLHGTSIRLAHTIVKRRLTWIERLAKRLGVNVAETEFDHVFGSRKVIKDPNNPNQDHYYKKDVWTEEGMKYAALIPENVVIYGELIGWIGNEPIQKGYTYDVPKGEARLFVYRVAVVSNDGHLYDLSWNGVKEFCNERGLNHVPELANGKHRDFAENSDIWLDRAYRPNFEQAVPLAPESPCDEGVCIRVDGVLPFILKHKSPEFLRHESATLDAEVIDIETVESRDV